MDKINNLLKNIALIFKEKHYTLVTVESCTGGGLAYYITKYPESSPILDRGFITYSISSKEEMLKISNCKLQTCGAVSKEISIEMAEKALQKSKAQISIAITGFDQSVIKKEDENQSAFAWISCASIDNKSISKKFITNAKREKFCEQLIVDGLKMLLTYIKNK
jgi:nicotinamide-nucleotide amidase